MGLETWDWGNGILDLEYGISDKGHGIKNIGYRIRDMVLGYNM